MLASGGTRQRRIVAPHRGAGPSEPGVSKLLLGALANLVANSVANSVARLLANALANFCKPRFACSDLVAGAGDRARAEPQARASRVTLAPGKATERLGDRASGPRGWATGPAAPVTGRHERWPKASASRITLTSQDLVTARCVALWRAQTPIWSGWLGRGDSSRQRGRWGCGIGAPVATLGGENRLEVALGGASTGGGSSRTREGSRVESKREARKKVARNP